MGCFSRVLWLVVLSLGCGGGVGTPTDGSSCRPVTVTATALGLRASPGSFWDDWIPHSETRTFVAQISNTDCSALGELIVTVDAPWLSATVAMSGDPALATLRVTVDSAVLTPGDDYNTTIQIRSADSGTAPVEVTVRVRALAFNVIHYGPDADTCPHLDGNGDRTTACTDHARAGSLSGLLGATGPYRVLLYDDLGQSADYTANIIVPADTWISAAPGIPHRRVRLSCSSNGRIYLSGDRIHLSGLTIAARLGCSVPLATTASSGSPTNSTGGHLIERVRFRGLAPGWLGDNGIDGPFIIGTATTVRNCLVTGFFASINLTLAHGSRLVNNTFVYHRTLEDGLVVAGAQDLVIANNVVLALTREEPQWIIGSNTTQGLRVAGNVLEGFASVAVKVDSPTNEIVDNSVGPAPLESPRVPRFLADAQVVADTQTLAGGTSLDDVVLGTVADRLPGAFARRSARSGPRHTVVRLGWEDCGSAPCDIYGTELDSLQHAVWSAWPGSTVEVYPSGQSYVSGAILGWGLSIVGMGAQPEDVVIRRRLGDTLTNYSFESHHAIIVLLRGAAQPLTLDNVVVREGDQFSRRERLLVIEGSEQWATPARHTIRRVHFRGANVIMQQALSLGDNVLLQDSLIRGPFAACISYGSRPSTADLTPRTTGWVVNVTCRLRGDISGMPTYGAFQIAAAVDSLFVNVLVELNENRNMPLFTALRYGTTDIDLPTSITAANLTVQDPRGRFVTLEGFAPTDPGISVDVDWIDSSTPLFVSPDDSHLVPGSAAIDAGVDPATMFPSFGVGLGVSLDAIARGATPDRGAYEQAP